MGDGAEEAHERMIQEMEEAPTLDSWEEYDEELRMAGEDRLAFEGDHGFPVDDNEDIFADGFGPVLRDAIRKGKVTFI